MRTSQHVKIASFKSGLRPEDGRRFREKETQAIRAQKRECERNHQRNIFPKVELENQFFDFTPFMQCANEEKLIEVLSSMRKILSHGRDDLVLQVYQSGILQYLARYLSPDYPEEIQYETAWLVTNITSSILFDKILLTYVKPLAHLFIRSPDMKTRIQSLWAITNIFGSIDILSELVDTAFFECLVLLAGSVKNEEFLKVISWSIFAILRNNSTASTVPLFIPIFRKILSENKSEEIIINVCWCLYNITSTSETHYKNLADHGIIPVLMEHLNSPNRTIVYSAIRVLANFAMGDIEYTDEMLQRSFLERVRELLILNSGYDIHKECCWALSNIAAGSAEHTQQILSHGIAGILSQLFDNTYSRIQGEIVYIIYNILNRKISSYTEEIVNCKLFYPLVVFMERKNIDLVKISMDGFLKLFSTELPSEMLEKMDDLLDQCAFQEIVERLTLSDVPEIALAADELLQMLQK
jgi:importin subunit alpha-6/7